MGLFSNLFKGKEPDKSVKGYLVWEFGYSREGVKAQGFGPYKTVPSTGGLETASASFMGRPTNVSFIFGDNGLKRIQIWAYVGRDKQAAVKAFGKVHDYMKEHHGDVESTGLRLEQFSTTEEMENMILKMIELPSTDQVRKLQIKASNIVPENVTVFSSFMEHPTEGFFVFLYYDKKS